MTGVLRTAVARAMRAVPAVRRLIGDRDAALVEVERLTAEVERLTAEVADRRARLDGQEPDAASGTGEYPPGHFHSPIPDIEDVWARESSIFANRDHVPGIDLRSTEQLALLQELAALAREHPWADGRPGLRYRVDNHMVHVGDALVLYGMLLRYRPARVVEVGSGFTSALMLDTDDLHLGGGTQFTFIDPYPDRLQALLSDADRERVTVLDERVELLDPSVFTELTSGDLLFIDSSHVSRIGSDVNHLFLEVLPRLPAGVLVHIHDIPWPFEYWRRWVEGGRYWNEAYLLRALLIGNPRFEVLWFSSYMERVHRAELDAVWPEFRADLDGGASFWMRTG